MEYWDAYDQWGRPTGGLLVRGEPVPAGCYHIVVAAVVEHADGDFLLMKRHPGKQTHPGKWEAGASGSVLAGEGIEEAALRELQEETGLVASEIKPLYEATAGDCLFRGFLCRGNWPKHSVQLQEGETVDYRWVSREELARIDRIEDGQVILHAGLLHYLGLPDGKKGTEG